MFGPKNRATASGAARPCLVELHRPRGEAELLLFRSVLDGAGIPYFVKGDHFGSLTVGPAIDHYNTKTVFVHPEDHEEAGALLAEFLAKTGGPRRSAATELRPRDVVRMVLEVLLFGWFMPGRRHRATREPRLRLIRGGRGEDPPDRKVSGGPGHP